MDPDAIIVTIILAICVGLPVSLGIGSSMFKRWIEHREAMAGALNLQAAEKAAQYAAHAERLEQRMRVIERIVTDKGLDVADQIERLRASPPHSLTEGRLP